jgi:hypothetical protein
VKRRPRIKCTTYLTRSVAPKQLLRCEALHVSHTLYFNTHIVVDVVLVAVVIIIIIVIIFLLFSQVFPGISSLGPMKC